MEKVELRKAFIEALKQYDRSNNMVVLMYDVSLICLEKKYVSGEEIQVNFSYERYRTQNSIGGKFIDKYWGDFSSLYWEFITNGIITVGTGPHMGELDLQFFQITNYGKEWLETDEPWTSPVFVDTLKSYG